MPKNHPTPPWWKVSVRTVQPLGTASSQSHHRELSSDTDPGSQMKNLRLKSHSFVSSSAGQHREPHISPLLPPIDKYGTQDTVLSLSSSQGSFMKA